MFFISLAFRISLLSYVLIYSFSINQYNLLSHVLINTFLTSLSLEVSHAAETVISFQIQVQTR